MPSERIILSPTRKIIIFGSVDTGYTGAHRQMDKKCATMKTTERSASDAKPKRSYSAVAPLLKISCTNGRHRHGKTEINSRSYLKCNCDNKKSVNHTNLSNRVVLSSRTTEKKLEGTVIRPITPYNDVEIPIMNIKFNKNENSLCNIRNKMDCTQNKKKTVQFSDKIVDLEKENYRSSHNSSPSHDILQSHPFNQSNCNNSQSHDILLSKPFNRTSRYYSSSRDILESNPLDRSGRNYSSSHDNLQSKSFDRSSRNYSSSHDILQNNPLNRSSCNYSLSCDIQQSNPLNRSGRNNSSSHDNLQSKPFNRSSRNYSSFHDILESNPLNRSSCNYCPSSDILQTKALSSSNYEHNTSLSHLAHYLDSDENQCNDTLFNGDLKHHRKTCINYDPQTKHVKEMKAAIETYYNSNCPHKAILQSWNKDDYKNVQDMKSKWTTNEINQNHTCIHQYSQNSRLYLEPKACDNLGRSRCQICGSIMPTNDIHDSVLYRISLGQPYCKEDKEHRSNKKWKPLNCTSDNFYHDHEGMKQNYHRHYKRPTSVSMALIDHL